MGTDITLKCNECKKNVEVTRIKLGMKSSDSIDCPFCNSLLHSWKKEPVDYIVKRQ